MNFIFLKKYFSYSFFSFFFSLYNHLGIKQYLLLTTLLSNFISCVYINSKVDIGKINTQFKFFFYHKVSIKI